VNTVYEGRRDDLLAPRRRNNVKGQAGHHRRVRGWSVGRAYHDDRVALTVQVEPRGRQGLGLGEGRVAPEAEKGVQVLLQAPGARRAIGAIQ